MPPCDVQSSNGWIVRTIYYRVTVIRVKFKNDKLMDMYVGRLDVWDATPSVTSTVLLIHKI